VQNGATSLGRSYVKRLKNDDGGDGADILVGWSTTMTT
jgi:hypothetical protein